VGAVAVLLAAAYLLRRRSRPAESAPLPAPAPPVTTSLTVEAVINEPETQIPAPVDQSERPLATWARVTIVAVALLAFFAVSLIATKQV
jgi:hypothetical protein